jgi:hypothetical protein
VAATARQPSVAVDVIDRDAITRAFLEKLFHVQGKFPIFCGGYRRSVDS